jgi:hypothetical protein
MGGLFKVLGLAGRGIEDLPGLPAFSATPAPDAPHVH